MKTICDVTQGIKLKLIPPMRTYFFVLTENNACSKKTALIYMWSPHAQVIQF